MCRHCQHYIGEEKEIVHKFAAIAVRDLNTVDPRTLPEGMKFPINVNDVEIRIRPRKSGVHIITGEFDLPKE